MCTKARSLLSPLHPSALTKSNSASTTGSLIGHRPTVNMTVEAKDQDRPLQASATSTPESYTLPSASALKRAGEVEIQDEHGKAFPLKSLYEDSGPGERQLVVFVRHFFCGVRPPLPFATH